ncbi:MAG: ArsI/CadI family heavy metal resistance metalloenzyme [Balneolaceae bacterium]|nr:ArsI/CadI family heavy metal resistance metalloenzyme [Balneolaceae bacterium]
MLKVKNLEESVHFYSNLFGTDPTTRKEDYAKWMLDDPRVNFSIAERPGPKGIEHLGIQAENEEELEEIRTNIGKASAEAVRDEGDTVCCYAKSDKSWISDPQCVAWEAFYTYGESETYSDTEAACC